MLRQSCCSINFTFKAKVHFFGAGLAGSGERSRFKEPGANGGGGGAGGKGALLFFSSGMVSKFEKEKIEGQIGEASS